VDNTIIIYNLSRNDYFFLEFYSSFCQNSNTRFKKKQIKNAVQRPATFDRLLHFLLYLALFL